MRVHSRLGSYGICYKIGVGWIALFGHNREHLIEPHWIDW